MYKRIKISKVANFINGYAFKPSDWEVSGLKIIRIQNLSNSSKPYNYTTKNVPSKYIIKKGDILVSWSATIDVFEWADKDAYLNQHIFKVEYDKDLVNKAYLRLALKRTINELSKYAHGSTMKHVVKNDFESHIIPLPSSDDQIRIATILSRSEALIAKRKESIRLLDELLKSTFLEMFGDPINMLSKINDKLEKHISFLTSGSRGWAKYYSETGSVFLRIQNVGKGNLILDDLAFVTPPMSAETVRTKVQTGDLLVSITADLGRTGVVPQKLNGA